MSHQTRWIQTAVAGALMCSLEAWSFEDGLPTMLWNAARANGCESFERFFEETESTAAPFVFGLFDDDISSAAFVCKWRQPGSAKIVVWRHREHGSNTQFTCSSVINGAARGGLRMIRGVFALNNYYTLESVRDLAPVKDWVAGPRDRVDSWAIEVDSVGTTSTYLCHRGTWYAKHVD